MSVSNPRWSFPSSPPVWYSRSSVPVPMSVGKLSPCHIQHLYRCLNPRRIKWFLTWFGLEKLRPLFQSRQGHHISVLPLFAISSIATLINSSTPVAYSSDRRDVSYIQLRSICKYNIYHTINVEQGLGYSI